MDEDQAPVPSDKLVWEYAALFREKYRGVGASPGADRSRQATMQEALLGATQEIDRSLKDYVRPREARIDRIHRAQQTAGVLQLLSGSAFLGIVVGQIGDNWPKITAGAISLLSGIITVYLPTKVHEKERETRGARKRLADLGGQVASMQFRVQMDHATPDLWDEVEKTLRSVRTESLSLNNPSRSH